ncbi:MAG: hypothetical protein WBB32_09540 [Flavobacteriales bacterium]
MAKELEGEHRKVAFEHTIDEVDSIKFTFKNRKGEKLRNLWLAQEDVQEAIACIEKVNSLVISIPKLDDLIVSALWEKAIMNYGRCFNSPVKLQASYYFKSVEAKQVHKDLYSLRQEYIGHQGAHNRYRLEVVVIPRAVEGGYKIEYHFPSIKGVGHFFEPSVIISHLKTFGLILERVMEKEMNGLNEEIWKEGDVLRWFVDQEMTKGNDILGALEESETPAGSPPRDPTSSTI